MNIVFRFHALQRMFQRQITEYEVQRVVKKGRLIEDYPNDTPYPSCLKMDFVENRPLHVVYALDKENSQCIIITVYQPSTEKWDNNFTKRK